MIDKTIMDKLREIGKQVKALFPRVNGNVQFNVGKDSPEPKVNLNLMDVTDAKGK